MIAVIKYNAGNIRSVVNALSRLGQQCMITDNKDDICKKCNSIGEVKGMACICPNCNNIIWGC